MPERSKAYLKQEFSDGERPTGADFADLIDSFLNKEDDNVRIEGGNLSVPAGLRLSNTTTGQEGTLRFTGTQIEVFQGGAWSPIGGAGGAFAPVDSGPDVAFGGGNVGIGSFSTAPTHRLEVPLGANGGPADRVRLGHLVVHNGQSNDAAYLSHESVSGDQTFAVRQDAQANTTLNSGDNAELVLSQNDVRRLRFLQSGNLVLTPDSTTTIDSTTVVGTPTSSRNLIVFGSALKPGGGPFTPLSSDERVKRDVKPLDVGLDEVRRLEPVIYKFNGKAGTPDDDKEYVGMIAQQVAEVVPRMVEKTEPIEDQDEIQDLLTLDLGPLTFILVQAVQELADRVDELEARLADFE